MGQTAAARADGVDVDDGQPQRQPGDLALGRQRQPPRTQRHIGARPAHVESDDIRIVNILSFTRIAHDQPLVTPSF